MNTEHPHDNDNVEEQILVKKHTVTQLATHLWNEINKEDDPPGNLLEHWDELQHAQTRHNIPGYYAGDLVVATLNSTGPATLWRVTNATHTETLDGTPTVMYHVESPSDSSIENTYDPEHLCAADEYDGEFVMPTRA